MKTTAPLHRLLCLAIVISTPTRSVCGFSPPSRIIPAPHQHFDVALQAATLDGSFFNENNGYPISSPVEQPQTERRTFITAAIGSYLTLLLQKLTWDTLLPAADCTADVLEASQKLHLPNRMAFGALLSICAAIKMIIGSSIKLSFSSLSAWYLRQLEVAPLITKCITGGIIALMGDYGAQWFEYKNAERKKLDRIRQDSKASIITSSPRAGDQNTKNRISIHGSYNLRRGLARFLECLLISSPLMHYGYDLFEQIIPTTTTTATGLYSCLAALSHVLADSVFLDGIFVMTGILATSLLEGHPLHSLLPNLRNVYIPTLKASVVTSSALMPLQFLSFRFLPVQFRVLSVNAVDLIWTGVVSFVSHGGEAEGGSREV